MVLFEKPITLALQKVLICFCTITIFLFRVENVLIIGVKMPIINTFLPIKNIYSTEIQKNMFFRKLQL